MIMMELLINSTQSNYLVAPLKYYIRYQKTQKQGFNIQNKYNLQNYVSFVLPFKLKYCISILLIIKGMQPNISSPHIIRSSYGFPIQQQFPLRSPENKVYYQQQASYFPSSSTHHEHLSNAIKSMESRIQNYQSPTRKANMGEASPTLFQSDPKFKTHFSNNSELRPGDSSNDTFLRSSCSNILRKMDQGPNGVPNLRNTTHFNPINKFPMSPSEIRKPTEDNPFKSSNVSKGTESTSSSGTYLQRPSDKVISRTPSKICMDDKKNDESSKFNSHKTPIKYKNPLENTNKNSNITKSSTEAEEKKTFKSLNEIVQSKAKEKFTLQKNQSIKKSSKIVNGFELGPNLGKGKFGQVFLSRHSECGFIAAMKKISKKKVLQYKMLDQLCTQIRLHSSLDHPNIVKLFGFFDEKEDIYLVIEYMNGGTLFDYLNEVNCVPLRETIDYLRDIIEAIVYMHEKSIAHRDIKPENIVISSEGVAKLCDFGWSALVQTSRKTYCGTFDYAPPQILQRKSYDMSVDIWCIGILTYELLTGRVPFEGDQRNVIMQKIVNVDKTKIDYPANFPPEAKQFIEALIQKDPALRPKSQDLLKFKLFMLHPRIGSKGGSTNPTLKKMA